MLRLTKFAGVPQILLMGFLCGAIHSAKAGAGSILAPVVEVKGSANTSDRDAGKSPLRTGESLEEGSVIRTGSDGGVVISPLPGVAVSVAKNTSVALLRLGLTKSGDAVRNRDVELRLDVGTLSFSLDKRTASTTSFAVQTLHGAMHAHGSVGSITVIGSCVKIASLSGKVSFTPTAANATQTSVAIEPRTTSSPTGQSSTSLAGRVPIVIEPGWFLAICGKGDNLEIRVINTISRTWTSFSADGTQLETRAATMQELESTRVYFEMALAHGAVAVSYGLLSAEGAAEVTATLTKINQSFAEAGLPELEATTVGSTRRRTSSSESTPDSSGFPGGSANPANTSGEIISPEQ